MSSMPCSIGASDMICFDSGSGPIATELLGRSSIEKLMDKAKAKMSKSQRLPDDEKEFEKAKAKEIEKQRRKEEYERLGLAEKTKFGTPGAGGWRA